VKSYLENLFWGGTFILLVALFWVFVTLFFVVVGLAMLPLLLLGALTFDLTGNECLIRLFGKKVG
jgi:hypothetical protein